MADTTVGASPEVATPVEPGQASPPSAPVATPKVDLTQIPEYRRVQSEFDRRDAENKAQIAQLAAEVQRVKDEAAARELKGIEALAPEERAEKYRSAYERAEAQRQADIAAAEIRAQTSSTASTMIARAGVDPNDSRLGEIWKMPPGPKAIQALSVALVDIANQDKAELRARLDALEKGKPAAEVAKLRQAEVRALNEAGVTQTSNASSVVAAPDPEQVRNDRFKARLRALSGKGLDNPGYRALVEDLRKVGMTTGDLV